MFALQRFCIRLSEGESHDGWITLETYSKKSDAITAMNRPFSDGRPRELRVVELSY